MIRPASAGHRHTTRHPQVVLRPSIAAGVLLALAACGGDSPTTIEPPGTPPVATVRVDPETATLVPAQEIRITASLLDSAGNPVPNATPTWSSSAESVVRVNAGGVATGVGAGTARITATSGTRSASVTIEVREGSLAGAGGATVEAAAGVVTLEVPAGALSAEVPITVATAADPSNDDGVLPGLVFEFGPEGTAFAEPVTIRIVYDRAALPVGVDETTLAVHRWNGSEWTLLPDGAVDPASATVSATTTGFSIFALRYLRPAPQPGVQVYLAGTGGTGINTTAYQWVNGQRQTLRGSIVGGTGATAASGIAVDGDDVYVAGYARVQHTFGSNAAVYWKNGQMVALTDGAESAEAYDIAVHDGVVHVVGYERQNGREVATHWIDGLPHRLADPRNYSEANSITIVNGEVFIAGKDAQYPLYWRNGVRHELARTYEYGPPFVNNILLQDGSVYVSGTHWGQAAYSRPNYWVDGELHWVTPGALGPFSSFGMAVSGSDIYVVGRAVGGDVGEGTSGASRALYWKNFEEVWLTDGSTHSEGLAIALARNGDVYVAGFENQRPALWLNDERVTLSIPAGTGRIMAMKIVER